METPSDVLEEVYDLRAELDYAAPVHPDRSVDRKLEVLIETMASFLPCEALLDAGCGDGRHLAALATIGPVPEIIVGTDISDRILDTARAATLEAGVPTHFLRANLEQLPLPDVSFDVVLCSQVIEHLLAPAEGARELARVLRPGGVLVLSTDNRANRVTRLLNAPRRLVVAALRWQGRRKNVEFPHRDFSRAELEALVVEAGLTVERVRTFRFTLMNTPTWVQRLLNRLDRRLPDLGWGDILLVVARRER